MGRGHALNLGDGRADRLPGKAFLTLDRAMRWKR
jgi:hypothetical protein